MLQSIEPHPISYRPKCLLVGNGINRRFNDPSWQNMINEELQISNQDFTIDEIRDMPSTMQIVVATDDHVDERMKALSDQMLDIDMTDERKLFLRELLDLPVNDVLTANYSLELEMASGMPARKSSYSSRLRKSQELGSKEQKQRLYQYYELSDQKRIWHVHGDVAKPDTMLMGHYYYAKQLRAIQDCIGKTVQRYASCKKEEKLFTPYSWVDQFLTGDVFIIGLAMYFCESDLWYLTCCKKRNFPDTKIFFYELIIEDICKQKLLEAYHVQIIDGIILGATSYDTDFYPLVFKDIRDRITMEDSRNRG